MRQKLVVAALVLLAVAAGATVFVVMRRNAAEKARAQAASDAVKAAKAAETADIVLGGTIGAFTLVNVAAPLAGTVKAFHAEVGSEVYEGQLIAEIQNEGLEVVHEHATLDLEQAQTRVNNLESTISAARLEASRASADAIRSRAEFEKASRMYSRQKLLLAEGATPRNDFEKAEKQFQTLEQESRDLTQMTQNAEERVLALTRDLDAARKLLESKVADLEASKGRVEAGQVVSPVSGIVAGRKGDVGGEVHPTMEDLFQIATDTSKLVVTLEPPPNELRRIRQGDAAGVSVADVPNEVLSGTVIAIEGTKVKVEFANPSPLVKPGQTAQVRIRVNPTPAAIK